MNSFLQFIALVLVTLVLLGITLTVFDFLF